MVFQVGSQPEQRHGCDKREWHCWGLRKRRASDWRGGQRTDWEGLVDLLMASGLGELSLLSSVNKDLCIKNSGFSNN